MSQTTNPTAEEINLYIDKNGSFPVQFTEKSLKKTGVLTKKEGRYNEQSFTFTVDGRPEWFFHISFRELSDYRVGSFKALVSIERDPKVARFETRINPAGQKVAFIHKGADTLSVFEDGEEFYDLLYTCKDADGKLLYNEKESGSFTTAYNFAKEWMNVSDFDFLQLIYRLNK